MLRAPTAGDGAAVDDRAINPIDFEAVAFHHDAISLYMWNVESVLAFNPAAIIGYITPLLY